VCQAMTGANCCWSQVVSREPDQRHGTVLLPCYSCHGVLEELLLIHGVYCAVSAWAVAHMRVSAPCGGA
jgi:hypothetical protein